MVVDQRQTKRLERYSLMTIIRQQSLFGFQELYEMEPTQRYESIISTIDLDTIYYEVNKKSRLGAPVELNYPAMIISFFIRYVERIPTIKDLIKRLNEDFVFKLHCGFLVSDHTPFGATYSRLLTKLSESNILEKVQEKVFQQAIAEGFVFLSMYSFIVLRIHFPTTLFIVESRWNSWVSSIHQVKLPHIVNGNFL